MLLRNNRQTGPYSFEELVQMGLKPFDLIWVEGKSFGWSYPAEIEQLKPYVSEPQMQPVLSSQRKEVVASHSFRGDEEHRAIAKILPKNIFVSLPTGKKVSAEKGQIASSDVLEQKAEELRKRAQDYVSQKDNNDHLALETKYVRSLADAEEDFTSWVYAQKVVKKKAPIRKYATPIAALLFVIAIAVILTMTVFRSKPVSVSVTPVVTQAKTIQTALPDSNPTKQNANEPVTEIENGNKVPAKLRDESVIVSQQMRSSIASKPTQKVLAANNKWEGPENNPTVIVDNGEMTRVTEQKQSDIAEPGKKEKLGQKIEVFFDNLKNKREERKAASVSNDGNERSTVRRSVNEMATLDLTESVTVTANERANDWMMGIQGLKLTLRNNSNHTLKSAEVEVKYFNEDNSLLEKKTVRFFDIPPKKAVSLPAPDHRMADHVNFQVLSAKGIENENGRQ